MRITVSDVEEHPEAVDWSIREKLSERTSRVGCEARQELSSVEIKSKPNRVSSRREVQGGR